MHVPTLIDLLQRRTAWDETIQGALNIIDHARTQGLPEYQIRAMYLDICEKILARVELNKAATE
jgi:hypothetical protein